MALARPADQARVLQHLQVLGHRLHGDAVRRGQLAAPYRVTVQAVSKHVKVLEDAGLVSRSGDSHRRPVHLEADVLDLMTAWIEWYRRQAEQRYRRLDAVLAAMEEETQEP